MKPKQRRLNLTNEPLHPVTPERAAVLFRKMRKTVAAVVPGYTINTACSHCGLPLSKTPLPRDAKPGTLIVRGYGCERCGHWNNLDARRRNAAMKAKTQKQPRPRRTLQDAVDRLTEAVNKAKADEVKMNRHLGYADDYHRGSVAVSLRWDDVQALLDTIRP